MCRQGLYSAKCPPCFHQVPSSYKGDQSCSNNVLSMGGISIRNHIKGEARHQKWHFPCLNIIWSDYASFFWPSWMIFFLLFIFCLKNPWWLPKLQTCSHKFITELREGNCLFFILFLTNCPIFSNSVLKYIIDIRKVHIWEHYGPTGEYILHEVMAVNVQINEFR